MKIDADHLAEQVKLAYEFMEILHSQALAIIKEVETQLAQSPEELKCLRPGGYRYHMNVHSTSLERPQPNVADYYSVCFRYFEDRIMNTPLAGKVPPLGFVKIVMRERDLKHPEIRFGVITHLQRQEQRTHKWPAKVEDVIGLIHQQAFGGPSWVSRKKVEVEYEDSYVRITAEGRGVRLADIPSSDTIAKLVVDPFLEIYRGIK